MGSVDENVEVIKRAVAAANDRTMATAAPHIIAPGFVRHDPADALPGVAGSGGFMQALRSAMPDLRVTTEDIFGAGDRVAMRFRVTGTHTGEVLGIPPTGRRVEFSGINIYRLEHGKIAETWQMADVFGFMTEVGAVNGRGVSLSAVP